MRIRPAHSLTLLFALGLFGCGATTFAFTNSGIPHRPMTRHPASEVKVFSASTPSRPFIEVGMLEARGGEPQAVVMAKLREKAGELGCEGLIVLGGSSSTTGQGWATSTTHAYRSTCIVFDGDEPTAASDAAPAASAKEAPSEGAAGSTKL